MALVAMNITVDEKAIAEAIRRKVQNTQFREGLRKALGLDQKKVVKRRTVRRDLSEVLGTSGEYNKEVMP